MPTPIAAVENDDGAESIERVRYVRREFRIGCRSYGPSSWKWRHFRRGGCYDDGCGSRIASSINIERLFTSNYHPAACCRARHVRVDLCQQPVAILAARRPVHSLQCRSWLGLRFHRLFCGPGAAVGPLCVCLCVQLSTKMTFDLEIWHSDSFWPSIIIV